VKIKVEKMIGKQNYMYLLPMYVHMYKIYKHIKGIPEHTYMRASETKLRKVTKVKTTLQKRKILKFRSSCRCNICCVRFRAGLRESSPVSKPSIHAAETSPSCSGRRWRSWSTLDWKFSSLWSYFFRGGSSLGSGSGLSSGLVRGWIWHWLFNK
jgi:hypothetical protein